MMTSRDSATSRYTGDETTRKSKPSFRQNLNIQDQNFPSCYSSVMLTNSSMQQKIKMHDLNYYDGQNFSDATTSKNIPKSSI